MKKIRASIALWESEIRFTADQIATIERAGGIRLDAEFAERMQSVYGKYRWQTLPAASIADVKAKLEKFANGARLVQSIMREWASGETVAEVARDTIGQSLHGDRLDPGLQEMVAGPREFRRLESVFRRLAVASDNAGASLPKDTAGRPPVNASIGDLLIQAREIFDDAGGRPKKWRAFETALFAVVGYKPHSKGARVLDKAARRKRARAGGK